MSIVCHITLHSIFSCDIQYYTVFIIDFYCATARVAIELDGSHHENENVRRYDEQRTAYLSRLNIKVIRFSNERVHHDIQGVLTEIKDLLDSVG